MKAPSFAYARPRSLEEALELLARPGAKALAGGQSLIPSLNLRLSSPELLVDLGALSFLRKIEVRDAVLRIGALTTHADLEKSDVVREHVPLLADAVPHVAHPAIRNRGTIGGSLALADPAAEYPAVAVALKATLVIAGRKGERRVPAERFFKGLFETALDAGELLVAAEFPLAKAGERSAFLELARRHGDYAIIGLAAHRSAGGTRVAYFSAGSKPFVIESSSWDGAKQALAELDPPADLYNTAATKRHLAGVLLQRAWTTLEKPR